MGGRTIGPLVNRGTSVNATMLELVRKLYADAAREAGGARVPPITLTALTALDRVADARPDLRADANGFILSAAALPDPRARLVRMLAGYLPGAPAAVSAADDLPAGLVSEWASAAGVATEAEAAGLLAALALVVSKRDEVFALAQSW